MAEYVPGTGDIDPRFSGLERMDEPIRDDILPGLAVPNPDLYMASNKDPYSYSPEEIAVLSPSERFTLGYALLGDVPVKVLESGRSQDVPKSQAQETLEAYGFKYELDYQLSPMEREVFGTMSRIEIRGVNDNSGADGLVGNMVEVNVPDRLRQRRIWMETGKGIRPPERIFEGYKLSRYERYLLEEQLKKDRASSENIVVEFTQAV